MSKDGFTCYMPVLHSPILRMDKDEDQNKLSGFFPSPEEMLKDDRWSEEYGIMKVKIEVIATIKSPGAENPLVIDEEKCDE